MNVKHEYKGQVYLFGESHFDKRIKDKENEIWCDYYNKGVRHLFIENPYHTAEFLNFWLLEKDDYILETLYSDWEGTLAHNQDYFMFFKQIKNKCPKTIFHGTDIGNQFNTTGERFLKYLEDNNLKMSKQYTLTKKAIKQGINFYNGGTHAYRENMMAANFIREMDQLKNADIVGFYGAAHTGLDSLDWTGNVPSMANQLKTVYKDIIHSKDLSILRVDKIFIKEKEYKAYYYGKQNITGSKGLLHKEFWRLEGAYENLKHMKKTGEALTNNHYPLLIKNNEVYVIDFMNNEQKICRVYYISDGKMWNGQLLTEEIDIC